MRALPLCPSKRERDRRDAVHPSICSVYCRSSTLLAVVQPYPISSRHVHALDPLILQATAQREKESAIQLVPTKNRDRRSRADAKATAEAASEAKVAPKRRKARAGRTQRRAPFCIVLSCSCMQPSPCRKPSPWNVHARAWTWTAPWLLAIRRRRNVRTRAAPAL